MTVVKVVEDIAFGAHWPCQSIGRGLCAKVQTGGSPRASREPLVASADEPSVGPEKDRHFSQGVRECREGRLSGRNEAFSWRPCGLNVTPSKPR